MSDEKTIVTILRKLPRSLSYAASVIRHKKGEGKRDLEEVIEYLIDEAAIVESARRGHPRPTERGRQSNESNAAFASRGRGRGCGRWGPDAVDLIKALKDVELQLSVIAAIRAVT